MTAKNQETKKKNQKNKSNIIATNVSSELPPTNHKVVKTIASVIDGMIKSPMISDFYRALNGIANQTSHSIDQHKWLTDTGLTIGEQMLVGLSNLGEKSIKHNSKLAQEFVQCKNLGETLALGHKAFEVNLFDFINFCVEAQESSAKFYLQKAKDTCSAGIA